jgi:hypothetical protein
MWSAWSRVLAAELLSSRATFQDHATLKLITPMRVMSFLLLATCGAICQSELSSADVIPVLGYDSPDSHQVQSQELRVWKSLPDAPSAQAPTQAEKFRTFVDEASSPLTFGAAGVEAGIMRETEVGRLSSGRQASLTDLYKGALIQKESSAFFSKYLYPALLRQDPRYHPSSSPSFLGRATYAASRILITRNDSGKTTLNTSYFLGVLTSVVISTAYRPYWRRSTSATFGTFGSTIGSDAGINLLHEFGPGIRKMVMGHAPKFVSRIEEHITNDQPSSDVITTPR